MSAPAWRNAEPDDSEALRALMRACDAQDGTVEADHPATVRRLIGPPSDYRDERHVGVDDGGRIVAATASSFAANRVFLVAYLLPEFRAQIGVESHRGLVEVADMFAGGELRFDRVLAMSTPSLPPSTVEIYEQLGFARKYLELELALTLGTSMREPGMLRGVSLARWNAHHEPPLREAYNDAFSTRGFAGYSPEEWQRERFSAQQDFLPECSFIALSESQIAGFVMCVGEVDVGEGWIDSVGVRPAWRGKGIADALLTAALAAMRNAGMATAALRVNEDNPRAIAVYRRLGFQLRRKHEVWSRRPQRDR